MLQFVPSGFAGLVEMREAVVTRLFGREWAGSIDIYEDSSTGELSVVDELPGPDENKIHEAAERCEQALELILRALADGALTVEVDVGGPDAAGEGRCARSR